MNLTLNYVQGGVFPALVILPLAQAGVSLDVNKGSDNHIVSVTY
jgi:hypothetical protein